MFVIVVLSVVMLSVVMLSVVKQTGNTNRMKRGLFRTNGFRPKDVEPPYINSEQAHLVTNVSMTNVKSLCVQITAVSCLVLNFKGL